MADQVSLAASITGLVSLGLQVSQSLVEYYVSYRGQNAYIDGVTRRLEELVTIFQSLNRALEERKFREDERPLIEQIENSISNCETAIHELQFVAQKIRAEPKGLKDQIKTAGRRITYPFRESSLKKLEEEISDIRRNISLAQDVLQTTDIAQLRDNVEDIKELVTLVRSDQISQSLINWLRAPDASVNHNEACAKRNPGSGLWLVNSTDFTAWLETNGSFMWISGFAGSGKSVLCSTVIQQTFLKKKSNKNIGIAFFYFTFNDKTKQNLLDMLSAFVLQLSGQLDNGATYIERLKSNCHGGSASIPQLDAVLQDMVQQFEDVYLIIDALDESPIEKSRPAILKLLNELVSWSGCCQHILVTSRDIPDIREAIQHLGLEASMKNEGVDKDISDFISRQLEEDMCLKKWSPYRDFIKEALVSRAQGVFRWVECQFTSLARCTRTKAALKKQLASLPESLDETYERMLSNISENCKEHARRIFTLLCFAKRPLTAAEVIDGVAVKLGEDPCVDLEDRMIDESDILEVCPGFIDVSYDLDKNYYADSDDDDADDLIPTTRLRIAHFSVQEYLESPRIRQQEASYYSLNVADGHTEIAQICLTYLLDPLFSTEHLTKEILLERPMSHYAAQFWHYHYFQGGTNDLATETQIWRLFQTQPNNFGNWIRIFDMDTPWLDQHFRDWFSKPPSAIYYASLLGLTSTLSSLLIRESKGDRHSSSAALCNIENATYGNLLQAASIHGYENTVQLLLDKGSDINAQGGLHNTALQAASKGGYEKIVQLLLDKGADINIQGGLHGTALQAASTEGYERIVQLLLDRDADHGDALERACREGHENIVQLLLDKSVKDNNGSALEAASDEGHGGIVRLLLDKGATAKCGRALQKASYRGYESITQLLLNKGAEDEDGSALWAASNKGHEGIVQLLLNNGADAKDGYALKAASDGGYKGIVQLLLDKGADPKKSRALQAASDKGHEGIVQLLLDKGADAKDSRALRAASTIGHEGIMQLLLDKGADATDGFALRVASDRGHEGIVRLLLDKGANAKDSRALQAASTIGHEHIVRLLLDRGADANDSRALQSASMMGHEGVVWLLVWKRADIQREQGKQP